MPENRPVRDQERLTLAQAAEVLGLSKDGVRMRVRRGTLRSEKGADGRVYVFVSDQDVTHREVQLETSEGRLVEELRDRVDSLERMLTEEREARTEERRRHDTLMAQLMQRIPELEPPAEAPPQPRGGPERAADRVESTDRPEPRSPQEGSERSWWRRIFGS